MYTCANYTVHAGQKSQNVGLTFIEDLLFSAWYTPTEMYPCEICRSRRPEVTECRIAFIGDLLFSAWFADRQATTWSK